MSVSEGKLNRHDTVVRTTDLLSTTIDGQVVVTSIEKGNYIGLEGAGNHIWSLIERPIRISSDCCRNAPVEIDLNAAKIPTHSGMQIWASPDCEV